MSFTAKLLSQRGQSTNRLYHIQSEQGGKPVYHFALIDPTREKEFLAALKGTELFDLNRFALEIVDKGFGEPSEELLREMEAKYELELEAI